MKFLANTGMSIISRILRVGHNATVKDIVERSASARVEPYTMIDSALLSLPEIKTILQCATSHYSAFYATAFALETDIGLETTRILDSLATDRRARSSLLSNAALIGEDFSLGLPVLAGEAREEPSRNSSSMGRDNVKVLMENTNLSVGKVLELSVERNGEKITVPVTVRLHTIPVQSDELAAIMCHASKENTTIARIKLLMDGDIEFVEDFLLNSDLIKENRILRKADQSGAYTAIAKRGRNNFWSGLLSANPSINVASAISIIDSDTLKDIESRVGARLADGGKARKALFDNTRCMLIIAVDRKWEQATFYYRSIDRPMKIDFDDMKISNKTGSGEMEKILASLVKSTPPQF